MLSQHRLNPSILSSELGPTLFSGLQIKTSNRFLIGMWAVLAGFTVALGPLAMFNLYFMPYWLNVMWLDAVTYLHHHGPEDEEKIPWYRGEVTASGTPTLPPIGFVAFCICLHTIPVGLHTVPVCLHTPNATGLCAEYISL